MMCQILWQAEPIALSKQLGNLRGNLRWEMTKLINPSWEEDVLINDAFGEEFSLNNSFIFQANSSSHEAQSENQVIIPSIGT